MKYFIERGVLQLRQPHVRPKAIKFSQFLKETPQLPCTVASRTNKGGHHGCTPKQIWIGNVFMVYGFQRDEMV